MRRVLFLDDSEARLNQAENFFGPMDEYYLARTAETAIRLLSTVGGPWDLVMLDHDLGLEAFQDSDDPTSGMQVVRYIERTRIEIEEIIVHSWNPPAAGEMVRRLGAIGYNVSHQPFQSLT